MDLPRVLILDLDSCAVMRGTKTGVETRIRQEKAPQLLDIDGDSCHHVHNACKRFSKLFNQWIETLLTDVHNDLKWSTDLCELLEEICVILGVTFTMPQRFVNHRWLSCYNEWEVNVPMIDPLTLFYFAFMNASDQELYKEAMMEILTTRGVSEKGKDNQQYMGTASKKKTDAVRQAQETGSCQKVDCSC